MGIHSAQNPTQAPHQRPADYAAQISNPLALSPEKARPNQIQSLSMPQSVKPPFFALTDPKSQGCDFSSKSFVDRNKSSAEISVSFKSTHASADTEAHHPNSEADIAASDQPDKGAGLKPLEQFNKSSELSIDGNSELTKNASLKNASETGFIDPRVIKKVSAQSTPINDKVDRSEGAHQSQNFLQASANPALSNRQTIRSESVGLHQNFNEPFSKAETPSIALELGRKSLPANSFISETVRLLISGARHTELEPLFDNVKTENPHMSRSYLHLGANPSLSNLENFSSQRERWFQHHIEPMSKTDPRSTASNNNDKAISQPSKTKISEQFGIYSLKDLTDTSFIKPSFSVAAVEQVNPEIDPLPQIDLGKTTFQTVSGFEKNHHLIMQQIAPKLIDQLVLRGDGKIEIMLSPKELGKVEFSFQSHDKSGLSIVILAERDETATLVRRHMEVLTKEFERLGYSNIDFSCDGQSDHQKSKSNSAKVSEEIGAANSQDPTAQKAATIAQDYSLSTEVDIRL